MESKHLLKEEKPNGNITVLITTCSLFALFVIAEIIGALASNSLSLLGDSAAMAVDVFTYIANLYAEWKKAKDGTLDPFTKKILEIYVPSFSVCALLGVTGYITADAINIIQHGDDGDEVNVYFLFAFSSANFLVDIVSSFMFYRRGKEVLISSPISHDRRSIDYSSTHVVGKSEGNAGTPNLNMISALTHVGSDTLRTISVFVAAVISSAGKQDPSLCDAWAAIVVTITIIFAVIPLINEIIKAIYRKEEDTSAESSQL